VKNGKHLNSKVVKSCPLTLLSSGKTLHLLLSMNTLFLIHRHPVDCMLLVCVYCLQSNL